ncbi:LIC_13387 family protein [Nocardia sp. NPDC004260]
MRIPFYRIGAWCWIITGIGHSAGDVYLRLRPSAEDKTFEAVLRNEPFELMGTQRSHYQLFMGFSLAMGIAMALVGVLFLMLARFAAEPGQARQAGFVGLAASLGLLMLSVALEPPPPIVLFALASLAFAAAVVAPVRARRPATVG